ncbi:hypothetical protein F4561_005883 [Lipingzhangella halophila]|uniref:DUF397 domain-containing protein n=1 Tax=Lipingzhangella halophila TaxID=1783352 RepID=A0A7W7RN13_9ACTN|nr:DUF397 domain-containing protein [Lipingzhangella halophila]MBB4934989.1 hypothetical protein [Lipingzhangella halophila]
MRSWRKSSYSGGNNPNCVEVRERSTETDIRDSQNPHHGHLTIPTHEWQALLTDVKNHEL